MNEVSIIINGVRYDVVDAECIYSCAICDLHDICNDEYNICKALNVHVYDCFKKSDKSLRNEKERTTNVE